MNILNGGFTMPANYAVIENDKVINIVVAENDFAMAQGWVLIPDKAAIGWAHINGEFIDNSVPVNTIGKEKVKIKDSIFAIESAITQRRLREAVIGADNGWLKEQETAIAALRAQL